MWYEHPMYARDDAHDHLWERHTFTSAQKRTSATRQRITLRRIRARFLRKVALSFERERDFSPTNQLCTFIEAFGKKEHPPQHNERNDTFENNDDALNNLFSFSHHRKQPRFQRRRRKREREKERARKGAGFPAFSHRSFVEKKKRCLLRRKARKEARIRRRKYTTCTRTFCTKTRRRL